MLPEAGGDRSNFHQKTAKLILIHKRLAIAATRCPKISERVGVQQCGSLGKKKEAMPAFAFTARVNHALYPLGADGDGQHAKSRKAEACLVQTLFPGRMVGEQFSLKRTAREILAGDGHCATIRFQKEIGW